ncbi:hypothetical protein [Pararhodobacter marinus]|uniref:Uncharacterized protein n=1 Tax=Pararhodobacter marinus TaxID=2184063 RepID=A0A2U2CBD1_9RHOB|nr:hypothetical protein [Pararhodobacter marinus]PWE29208.1 hypothetical protein C4N9_10395 [Pararhodobacter marinus]
MTAPQTNVERQAKRHSPALTGITIAIALAVLAAIVFAFWPNPDDATPTAASVEEAGTQVGGISAGEPAGTTQTPPATE